MYVWRRKQYGKTYLLIMEPYREDGKNKRKTIKSLGYLEDLQKEHPDIENYLQKVLEETKQEHYKELKEEKVSLTVYRDGAREKKNIGYALAKKIYSKLGIREFLNNKTRHWDLKYNLNQVFLLLVMNRFVDPWSKRRAYKRKYLFFEKFDFSEQQMYQSLSLFSKLSESLQAHLYEHTRRIVELDKELCKYDVTNFFFYSDEPDENTVDEEGNVLEYGIKRYGPSKEGVYRPITQVGLLCDKNGIPMTYEIFSGGRSEKMTFLPIVDRSQKTLKIPKIIVIADRGINTPTNMYGLSGDNGAYRASRRSRDENIMKTEEKNGFIFGQTLRGQNVDLVNWVLDPEDYKVKEENGSIVMNKSRVTVITVKVNTKDKKKSQRKIRVKQLVRYDEKYAKRARHQREEILEGSEELSDDKGKYNQKSSRGKGKYVKDKRYAIVDGKKVEATEQELSVDYDKAELDALLDGYYCIVTSELDMKDEDVWANYNELHDIENCFRVSKSELNLRPVFVWTRDSINAHVLICFVSLLIFRILRYLSHYEYSSQEMFDAIRDYTLTYAGDGYYISDKQPTEIVKTIGKELNLEFEDHYMSESDIINLIKY